MSDLDGGDWLWMVAMMLVFWAAVILAIVAVARSQRTPTPGPTAEDTLRQRLANGDIDIDEYNQRLEALHRS